MEILVGLAFDIDLYVRTLRLLCEKLGRLGVKIGKEWPLRKGVCARYRYPHILLDDDS